ncbi:MAG: hypothetical protein QOJ54_2286, partial [Aliidongia sp.]|nr:hypothetical protein [Aliidongia sp.]
MPRQKSDLFIVALKPDSSAEAGESRWSKGYGILTIYYGFAFAATVAMAKPAAMVAKRSQPALMV